jgi:signal recognition particle subunit SRP54
MGNMKDLLGMIPGVGKAMKDVNVDDNAFKPLEAIIQSMTLKERENPEIINSSRKERIAKGSGTSVQQVNQLLKQFTELRKMMKTMNKMGGGKRALSALNPFGNR